MPLTPTPMAAQIPPRCGKSLWNLASGGILLLPDQSAGGHTHLLVQAGKEGKIYLVDRDSMGGYNSTTDNVVQVIPNPNPNMVGGLWSVPAFWNNILYTWGQISTLKAYSLSSGRLSASPVAVGSTSSGAAIYYTIDGTTPTTASTKYTGPVSVDSSLTLKAIATATGFSASSVASASYVISTSSPANFGGGFTSSAGLQLNGGSTVSGTRLRITNGGVNQARSVFWTSPVSVQSFTTDFTFQQAPGTTSILMGDGFTFVLQNAGPTALGPLGGALGYGDLAGNTAASIPSSIAIKLDLYDNSGEGYNSTGLYWNGAAPTNPSVDMTSSGVNLQSGNIMRAHIVYDGTNLALTITNTVTGAAFSTSWPIDIPGIVGSNTAYAGFAGGTGGATAVQDVITWTYTASGAAPAARTSIVYSTANLPTTSSGADFRTFVWSGFQDNQGVTLDSTAVGNSITFTVNVVRAGIYNVAYTAKKYSTEGQHCSPSTGSTLDRPPTSTLV